MNKTIPILCAALMMLSPGLARGGTSYLASLQQAGSVRAAGLGHSYTALAHFEDPLGLPANPAGLALFEQEERADGKRFGYAVAGGGLWRQGFSDYFGRQEFFALTLRPGQRMGNLRQRLPLALSFYRSQFGLDDIAPVDEAGNVLAGSEFSAGDAANGFAAALEMSSLFRLSPEMGRLYFGVVWNYITQEVGSFSRGSGHAVSLGWLYRWVSKSGGWDLRSGVLLRNAGLDLRNFRAGTITTGQRRDEVPDEVSFGLALSAQGRKGTSLLVFDSSFKQEGERLFKTALELRKGGRFEGLIGRVGYFWRTGAVSGLAVQEEDTWVNRLSLGVGLHGLGGSWQNWTDIHLDYALGLSNGDRAIGNLHQISFTFVGK